ncbi:MAG: LLM class flavin-dependent oxidoreductase [Dehalococcoidia bacterium]|nr:LLM class flavin-dependent oxidoreductase [Dehalococcoidia bacterium]
MAEELGRAVGVAVQAFTAADAVEQVRQAEASGIRAGWATIGGAGGADPMVAYAAALTATERIVLGTAIVPTWPRHPIALAHQALALEQLAPGRFRLGVGPSHEPAMTSTYGAEWDAPLTNLREYLVVLRALLWEGKVEFEGRHVTARAQIRQPVQVPILASALRPRSFEVCGELADGAISWMCPRPYLIEQALPALRRGAERAGRPAPPLIAHVPIAVSEDREAVHALANRQIGFYGRVPFYNAMFREAGFPDVTEAYPPGLLDQLVVSGTEEEVAERLASYIADDGMGEVLAHPLLDRDDREGSIARAFAAVARADALVRG